MNNKTELRKYAYKLRQELYQGPEHAEFANLIQKHVLESDFYKNAKNICMYASVKSEVTTTKIAEQAFLDKKNVYYPLCHKEEAGIMHYALCKSVDDLQNGLYDIPEPKAHCPFISNEELNTEDTLLLVPALLFDKQGFRLGYGQGYYDRFMAQLPKTVCMGLAFAPHVQETLPHEAWDLAVDYLTTNENISKIIK